MDTSYQNGDTAKKYIEFTASENGRLQQKVLWEAIEPHLAGDTVLDAACGGGWLAGKAAVLGLQVKACDFSNGLVEYAQQQFPSIPFSVADVSALPYKNSEFDIVIFNMAAHDVADVQKSFSEISRVTKPMGTVIVTVANPYYSFPVGVWKRGILGFLLRKKPKLLLRAYNSFKKIPNRAFVWNENFTSYFYTLPEYIEAAGKAHLSLTHLRDITADKDAEHFSLQYQLYQFPLMLLLVFKKRTE